MEEREIELNERYWHWPPYQGLILKHPDLSHLYGYVGVPLESKFYKLSYRDTVFDHLKVHGGLTFSDWGKSLANVRTFDSKWYFGFDCGYFDGLFHAHTYPSLQTVYSPNSPCYRFPKMQFLSKNRSTYTYYSILYGKSCT